MKSKDIIKVENLKTKDKFIIRWNVTLLCNYYCDFCIQGDKEKHLEKAKGESKEIREKICNNLIKFIETKINKKYKHLDIDLIGGEITILPDFIEIIQKIVKSKFEGEIKIHITTNLSADKEILKKLSNIFNKKYKYKRRLTISASYYKEFANEKEFIDKAKIIGCHVNYPLCTDEDYLKYLEFKNKYKKQVKDINFIIIKKYKTEISQELKQKIVEESNIKKKNNIKVTFNNNEIYYFVNNNKISLKLEDEEIFNSNGYLCDAGIHNITISNLGVVSRCVSCEKKTIIGDIRENIIDLPTEKLICPSNQCNCSSYRIIEKGDIDEKNKAKLS